MQPVASLLALLCCIYTSCKSGHVALMPLQQEHLFQIIIQGSVSIYFIRDDGSVYSLANCRKNDLLGEMEIFPHQLRNVYTDKKCKGQIMEVNQNDNGI